MNIIFGQETADHLRQKHVVLEVDTFVTESGARHTAYCVVENIPLADFPVLESFVQVHHDMMEAYRDRNWEYCRNAIQGLARRWNGELDTFYQDLIARVNDYEQQEPPESWDGSRPTTDQGSRSTA